MGYLDELKELLEDRWWRLNHLYFIEDKEGKVVRFRPNWAQKELHENLHYRNDILKVRQLGISTYIAILILDTCLFTPNYHCGIIDKSLPDAQAKLKKIQFAYEHLDYLPEDGTAEDIALAKLGEFLKSEIKMSKSLTSSSFSTGSEAKVGTSLRGGTYQLLHVSELAYVAAHAPIRAREIVNGAINAVSKDGIVIRESTHEGGKYGLNYEMTKTSMEMVGRPLSNLDWKFFFFSWINQDEYRLEETDPPQDEELEKYFADLKSTHGIELDCAQKAWYAAQWRTFGHAIRQEYPTVPEEAFQTQVEGAIYGKFIDNLRYQGRMNAVFEADDLAPLYASWDIGMSDYMSLWLFQMKGDGKYYVLDCIQASDKPLEWYVGHIRHWETAYGTINKHLLPHDASKRDWEGVSFEGKLRQAGLNVSIVPRTRDVWAGIFAVRRLLQHCVFHERCSRPRKVDGVEYMSGVNALENYQKAPTGSNGSERDEPLHNKCSHAADAFRTFAEGVEAGLAGKSSPLPKSGHQKPSRYGLAKGAADLFI